MTLLSAFITGVAGESLTPEEWRFLQEARPAGLILFDRNCRTPAQVTALIASFKDAVGSDDLLVLVDQEGGRVQRLKPPHWRPLPPAAAYGALYRSDADKALRAARAASQLVAVELARLGFTVNCVPVLDVPAPGAHGVIGERAYGGEPQAVIALGRAVAEGQLDGGVLPVIKHIPGHGRATRDSHHGLPVIDAALDELRATDFLPFKSLADLPLAMTAHVVVSAVDRRRPASTSPSVIDKVIRGEIGFDGLLMCDDLGMGALEGGMEERTRGVMEAGCDLALHCNGRIEEMRAVAGACGPLEGDGERRLEAALTRRKTLQAFDASEALAALNAAFSARG